MNTGGKEMVKVRRTTKETMVDIELEMNGQRNIQVDTGIGFFDHMITSLAFWAGWDLTLRCKGDLHVDTHHTVEDVGILLGQAFNKAMLNEKRIERIAYAFSPLDEALSRIVVDLCNRPYCLFDANFSEEKVGDFETSMASHFFHSFATEARITLQVHSLFGENAHHMIESMFKGLGLALRRALSSRSGGVASTKGVL